MEKKNKTKKMPKHPTLNSSQIRRAQLQRAEGRDLGVAIWIGGKEIRESFGPDMDSLFLFREDGELVLVECPSGGEGDPEPREIAVQRNRNKLLGVAVWIPVQVLDEVLNTPFGNAGELSFTIKSRDNRLVLQPMTEEVREER